jgi:hypothetical protein
VNHLLVNRLFFLVGYVEECWLEGVRAFQLLNGKRLAWTVFFVFGSSQDGYFEVRGVKPSRLHFLSFGLVPRGLVSVMVTPTA